MGKNRRIEACTEGKVSRIDVVYNRYSMRILEWIVCITAGFGIAFLVAWTFYQSIYGCITGILLIPLICSKYRSYRVQQRKARLLVEFKEDMRFIAGALQAGYSLEKAWISAEQELTTLYGAQADMVVEMKNMNRRIRLNESLEHVLQDFSNRSQLEDVENFAQIMNFAKRGGGDFLSIIWTTVNQISEKSEIREEINTMLAEKKMEQKIMNVVPLFLLAYLNITSPGFLTPMYHNLPGIGIMTAALIVYVVTILAAEKIMNIVV